MPDALLTLDQVAARLGIHPKTLRRLLPDLMDRMPALRVRKIGRTVRLTEHDFNLTVEAMAWRSASVSAARRGTREAPSASAKTRSKSESSAQEKLRELLRSKRESAKPGASERTTLTVLPGGRAA